MSQSEIVVMWTVVCIAMAAQIPRMRKAVGVPPLQGEIARLLQGSIGRRLVRRQRSSFRPFLKLPYDIRYHIYQLLVGKPYIQVRKNNLRRCGATFDCTSYPC